MPRVLCLCLVCLLAVATSVQAAPLVKLDFQDASAAPGSAFTQTTNAGTVVTTPTGRTWGDGEVIYTYGPGGFDDFAVQFVDKNVNHYLQRGGALEIANWPVPTDDFTLMFSFRHDPAGNHQQYDMILDGWNGANVANPGPFNLAMNDDDTILVKAGHKDLLFDPVPGQWYHFAILWQYPSPANPDRSYHRIFINGVETNAPFSQHSYNAIDPSGSLTSVFFGSRGDGYRPWAGAIDDVVYAEGLLNEQDVVAAYEASFTAPVPEPASMGLVLLGLGGLKHYLRRRRRG